jgi:hypothetical protein
VNDFFIPFGNIFSIFRSKAKGAYNFGVEIISAATQFNTFGKDTEKLAMVLSNPAVLKVFSIQCDLFSMGRVCVQDENGEEIPDDPFLNLLKAPNPFTKTETQFLWDFMFWNMLGTSYCYVDSAIPDRAGNRMYFLEPSRIEWPLELERKKDKMIFSDAEIKSIMKTEITYRYADGTTFKFPFDRLVIAHDLTNSIGNFFKGPSRLDALVKIISNSEHVLDSENINIRYTSKFMVGADKQVGATTRGGLGDDEKKDLIAKIDGTERSVYPVNAKINIQRFVENLSNLQLPQEYLHQYFLIGNMYNIPRDVLEAYASATYENQEKARAGHVSYTLEPKGNQFMDSFEVHFGYREQKKNILISWSHLPFVQVFAKDRVETQKATIDVLNSLLTMGVPIDEANKYLGTEFTIPPPSDVIDDNADPETLAAQASLRGSVGGVQGILAVQASVSAGTTSYEAALSILTIIYGFTDEQAKDLLGDPKSGQGQAGASVGGEEGADEGQPNSA